MWGGVVYGVKCEMFLVLFLFLFGQRGGLVVLREEVFLFLVREIVKG